ncbi:hypothetical protein BDFB_006281 [Asbolus verrucosus]|uniref:Uncharacterized protein n=1 Tax=Asbolus verrucosus TaxID=1661398 RepID=A0A482W0M9_ASBVE|nr:hypothetical protein BDFB_006281 [Asbolus verrucosus]
MFFIYGECLKNAVAAAVLTAIDPENEISVLEVIYQILVLTTEELKQRIRNECITLTPKTFRYVQRSFLNRVEACLLQNGTHFEQFLS